MFALRTPLPRSLVLGIRANATVAATSSASGTSLEVEGAKSQGRRRKPVPPARPNISLDNPRKWNKPLATGVVPAYDLALRLLLQDSANLKEELTGLRAQIAEKQKAYATAEQKLRALRENDASIEEKAKAREVLDAIDAELETMLHKADIVEVQSEINIPSVRWTVNNAMADMSKVSNRHLVEQKWRKDGDLDLLMERVYQMKVVPDVLPKINPSIDLHVVARTTPGEYLESKKVQTQVEPGAFLRPKQTLVPPKLRVNVFHTDVRLYTMLLLDPDVPHPETETFTTFLHWMKPNIALSATSPSHLTELNTHTKYIPPHPQRGTPYHRYVCLLLPQPPLGAASKYSLSAASRATGPTSVHLDIPVVADEARIGFDVREFAQTWNLNGANGGGVHMWREVWDEDVSKIYKDILNIEEPRYGRPPKVDVYAAMKQQKKYIL